MMPPSTPCYAGGRRREVARPPEGWYQPQEAGWWVKDGVGGVCREEDRTWRCYPHDDDRPSFGAYRTRADAIAAMEPSDGR